MLFAIILTKKNNKVSGLHSAHFVVCTFFDTGLEHCDVEDRHFYGHISGICPVSLSKMKRTDYHNESGHVKH